MNDALRKRILAFMRNAEDGDFARLALELFARQFEHLDAYRAECEGQGATPASIETWQQIPPGAADGIAGDSRTSHEILELALPTLFQTGSVSMIVGVEGSGFGQAGVILTALGGAACDGSLNTPGTGFDSRQLRSWLGARQRDRRPVRIVATEDGYRRLLETLERRGLKFRLPPGSSAYLLTAPGARKPGQSEPEPPPLREGLADRLGLPPDACPRILCSHFGTPLLEDVTQAGAFVLPHWTGASEVQSGPATILDLARLDVPACYEAPAGVGRTSEGRLTLGSP